MTSRAWVGRTALAIVLTALTACGDGGGPSGPPPGPVVSAVSPTQVRPGEQVTISGERFGTDAADVTVTFNGTTATIVSVTNTTIVATVPNVGEGAAAVVVTVNGRAATGVTVSVLRAVPVITGVSPASVRQGGTLTIQGQNLLAARRLLPSGAAIEVLLDGEPLPAQSVTNTQIVMEIPMTISTGSHEVRLRRGDELSNAVNVGVEVFTVTGAYELVGIVTFNDCAPGTFFAVGDTVGSFVTVTEARPTVHLTMRAQPSDVGIPLTGTLNPDGSFEVSVTGGGETSTVEGAFELAPDGEVIFVGRNVIADATCRVEVEFVALRVSTSAGALRPTLGGVALHRGGRAVWREGAGP